MIELSRVCIPVGLCCNFKCKYCYRDYARKVLPMNLSDVMKKYLTQLSPNITESVIISGGEPLIYKNKIKEVFSYVPKEVHKCIMSNCSLLTQDMVDYINTNNIELHLSHDGAMTKYLRGVDVLESKDIRNLISQVRLLMVFSVVTNKNCDVIANYKDTISKLGREDIIYKTNAVYDTGYNAELIKDFNYDLFAKSFAEYIYYYDRYTPFYHKSKFNKNKREQHSSGFNVDLAGNVINMNMLTKYGTVLNTYEECCKARDLSNDIDRCKNSNCDFHEMCGIMKSLASEHFCKCAKILGGIYRG